MLIYNKWGEHRPLNISLQTPSSLMKKKKVRRTSFGTFHRWMNGMKWIMSERERWKEREKEKDAEKKTRLCREPINWLNLIECRHLKLESCLTTHSTFLIIPDHVLELSRQSENKTLTLFSAVYRRMSPLSRSPILELYKSIRRWVNVNDFFLSFFFSSSVWY